MKKFFAFALFLMALPLLSSCSAIESPTSREEVLQGIAYNPGNDEWVFWLAVPCGSAELGMVRVSAENVSVCLRNDGGNYTTVRFFSPADKIRCRYFSAIVLAPNECELHYWQEKLGH